MEGALIAFGGIILGATISEVLTWWRERRTDRKAAKRVRIMINVEIEQNLELARAYFESLTRDYEEDIPNAYYREPEPEEIPYFRAWRLVSLPLPPWRNAMWQSQLSELTTALSEKQIRQCHRHHAHIDSIASLKATLGGLLEARRAESLQLAHLQDKLEVKKREVNRYAQDAPELWAECERAFHLMLGAGNPLADEAERLSTAKLHLSEADQAAVPDK